MSDLIERLRDYNSHHVCFEDCTDAADKIESQADEIERLKAKCAQRRDDLKQARDILDERFKEIERLRAAIKHIHWSMGVKSIHSDKARDNICPICDEALQEDQTAP